MNKEKLFLIVFFAVIAVVVGYAIFTVFSLTFFKQPQFKQEQIIEQNIMGQKLSKMSLSKFDKELAIEMMDKDHDGKCDVCGMPVEMCMDSGELQCSMDTKSKIGKLGSQHIHADFKVYLNGKPMNFDDARYYMKSSFIHVDPSENSDEASGLLHMHANDVPLLIFFKSVGIELPENTKTYVNGKEIESYENYVFSDLDKILITDSKGNLSEQLSSITDFAGRH